MKKLPMNLQFFAEDPNPDPNPAPAPDPAAPNVDQIVAAALTAMEARQQRAGNSVIQSMAEQHGMSADELTAAIDRAKAEKAKQMPPDVQKQLDEANAKVAAFQNKEAVDDFSVAVTYDEIKAKLIDLGYYEKEEDVLSYAVFEQVAENFFKWREAQKKNVDRDMAKNGVYPV